MVKYQRSLDPSHTDPTACEGRCAYSPGGGRCYYAAREGKKYCPNHATKEQRAIQVQEMPVTPWEHVEGQPAWVKAPISCDKLCLKCGTTRSFIVGVVDVVNATRAYTVSLTCRVCSAMQRWITMVLRARGPIIVRAKLPGIGQCGPIVVRAKLLLPATLRGKLRMA